MPTFKEHAPGTFCYCELASSDPEASQVFYGGLFGWQWRQEETGHGPYTQFHSDGQVMAALYKLMQEQEDLGIPPHWGQYITVKDAAAAVERTTALGGGVLMGPLDIMDLGAMAVLTDPTGAVFSVWQPRSQIGVDCRDEAGSMCWNELMTHDTGAAAAFYADLLGWQAVPMEIPGFPPYTAFMLGDQQWVGGMLAIQPQMGPIPPHWLQYFAAADLDGAHGRALELGARSMVPPTDIPGHGRFCIVRDPQGAVFGLRQAARKQ